MGHLGFRLRDVIMDEGFEVVARAFEEPLAALMLEAYEASAHEWASMVAHTSTREGAVELVPGTSPDMLVPALSDAFGFRYDTLVGPTIAQALMDHPSVEDLFWADEEFCELFHVQRDEDE